MALPCWQVLAHKLLLTLSVVHPVWAATDDSSVHHVTWASLPSRPSSWTAAQSVAGIGPILDHGLLIAPVAPFLLQGTLMESDRDLGSFRLLGPGPELHTLPRTLLTAAKFPMDQVPSFLHIFLELRSQSPCGPGPKGGSCHCARCWQGAKPLENCMGMGIGMGMSLGFLSVCPCCRVSQAWTEWVRKNEFRLGCSCHWKRAAGAWRRHWPCDFCPIR